MLTLILASVINQGEGIIDYELSSGEIGVGGCGSGNYKL
jgi:hypothetical protein